MLTFEIKINGAVIYVCSIINEEPHGIVLEDRAVYSYRFGVYDANACSLVKGELTHLRSEGALELVQKVLDRLRAGETKVVTKTKKRKTKSKLSSEEWNALRNVIEYTADEEEDYEGRSAEEKEQHIYAHIKVLKKLLEATR